MSSAIEADADGLRGELAAEVPRLRAFLADLIGRAGDVDDVLQETLLRALRYAGSFDSRAGSVTNWLKKTAVRVWIDRRRRDARDLLHLAETSEPVLSVPDGGIDARLDADRMLVELDPRDREILLLFHRDGRTLDEIASSLRMPLNSVKSRLHRARRKLRSAHPDERED